MLRAPRSPGASAEGGALWRPATVVLAVAALAVVRLLFASVVPITEDEAYYRLWGLNPAFGHLDHPPMVGWWIAAGIWFLGDGLLGIRAPSVVATVVGSLALWRTAFLLFGRNETIAGRSVLWFNATLLVGVGAIIATPDQPATLFWGLALWAVAEGIERAGGAVPRGRWWLAVGLFAGLGLLSKYSMLFFGAGLVLWLVTGRERRRAFLDPALWAGGLLAVAVFAPTVLWNAQHGWASFEKQFGRAAGDGLSPIYLLELIGGQIGLLGPLMVPFVVVGIVAAIRVLRRKRMPQGVVSIDAAAARARSHGIGEGAASLLLLTSLPFVLYLLAHATHDRVQANWPAPLYPALTLLAAAVAGTVGNRWLKALKAGVLPVGVGVGMIALSLAAEPLPGLSRVDPMARFRGWERLAVDVEEARRDTDAAWIATAGYGPTAMLTYYLPGVPVIQLDERLRYDNAPPPDPAILAKPGLLVIDAKARKTDWLLDRFAIHGDIGTETRWAAGRAAATFRLIRIADPKGDPLAEPVPASGGVVD